MSDELDLLQGEIPKLEPEISALEQETKALELSIESRKEEERATYEEDLGKRQSLAQKKRSLVQKTARRKDLEEQLNGFEERPVLDLLPKTSLEPFAEYLSSSMIGELLDNRDIDWLAFGDDEVFAFAALAQIWALRPQAQPASRRLCKHVLQFYYRENWDVIVTLASVTTVPEERAELDSIRDRAIDWSLIYDPKSRFYKFLRLSRCDEIISMACKEWPYRFSKDSPYDRAIELLEGAERQCADFPAFHYSLAFAYEYGAKQMAGDNGDRDRALEYRNLALRERREACRLAPENPEYRKRLLATAGAQLIAANTLEDPLEQRTVPRLIEVEVAADSVPDLGFTKTSLPAELQQRITDVRTQLKTDPGFTLPGINFRDNVSFEKGQFRFLIRGVPLPYERLNPAAPQNEQWDQLARRVKEVALNNGGRFYSSQDCYVKLREISSPDGVDYSDIQNDSDSLFALSWVLRMLLSERAPISDFASIVAEFGAAVRATSAW